jgi:competence protein ComEA
MFLRLLMLTGLALIGVAAGQPPADTTSPTFLPGAGRDTFIKVCSSCHGAESAVAQFRSHDDWLKTLDEMASNGAQGSDDEWAQIQAYLDKNYSFIFVNKATARDFQTTLDVTAEIAEAAVRRRAQQGEFKSIDDLKSVPGLDAPTIDARKDRLIF